MEKWKVTEVSQATGLSEGAISGFFSNRNISTKNGLDIRQIIEVLNGERRNHNNNDAEKVKKLEKILKDCGVITPKEIATKVQAG